MKDALGHGSNPHGGAAHQAGVDQVGRPQITDRDGRTYTVTHQLGVNQEHDYHVFDANKEIGEARMSHTGKYVVDLGVKPEYRGKGIASALYDHIEAHLGYPLEPSPIYQTAAGEAFWKSRRVAP